MTRKVSIRRRECGFIGLALVALLFLAAISSILGFAASSAESNRQERDQRTRVALAAAKEALIAFAVGNPDRGYLPCPADPTLAGTLTEGTMLGTCSSHAVRIGRLPWRSLGIAELRDGSGEPLWYAVSANFANGASTINSAASTGSLTINTIAGNAAIVFSAGEVLQGQIRTDAVALCSTTSGNLRNDYCAANYLDVDTVSGISNADANEAFAHTKGAAFNDQIAAVTSQQFFTRVEKRVLQDVKSCLLEYADHAGNTKHIFPWAHRANASEPDPADKSEDYDDRSGTNIGRIADTFDDSPYSWGADCPLSHCTTPGACTSNKNWLKDWREVVFYVVSEDFNPDGPGTSGGDGEITVGTNTNVRAAILIAGKPVTGQTRADEDDRMSRANYLEDNNLATYSSPPQTWELKPATSTFNDRVVVVAP